jgi:hypothetical protein
VSLEDVNTEVRALASMDLFELREEWRRLYGAPPKLRSVDLLARILAWRIQADAAGGLDAATRAALGRKSVIVRGPPLVPGMILTREWRGVRHEVEVVEGGFRYRGERHASLSGIARLIAGSRWNGPRFFGLRSAES